MQVTLIRIGEFTASKISLALDMKYSQYKSDCVANYGDIDSIKCWSKGGVEIDYGTQPVFFGIVRHYINYRVINIVDFEQPWNYMVDLEDF